MIHGIGNDIIEIKRIETAIQRHGQRFLDRLFSPNEQAYCQRHRFAARHFAGRFAAKEAIAKALGIGFGEDLSWSDIEITNDVRGKPVVVFSPKLMESLGDLKVSISISHCEEYATAFALCHHNPKG